jgi:hypothetical protein
MLRLAFVALALVATPVLAAGDYCSGFRDGFRDAYQRATRGVTPPTPPCPPTPPGVGNDPYRAGYLDGSSKGFEQAQSSGSARSM